MRRFCFTLSYIIAAVSVVLVFSETPVYSKKTRRTGKKEAAVKKSLRDILEEKKIDLDFEKKDIREVLKYMAKATKTNISLYERKKKEKPEYLVTIYLKDISALEALDVITRIKGLSYYLKKNIIWVGKDEELKDLMRVVTKAYSPRHGNVKSFEKMIRGLLSEEGKIIVDKQMNLLVITDREDVIRIVDDLFKRLYG